MADILIRNVDMPEDCFSCFAYDGEWGECNFSREECCIGRPKWCPLVNFDEARWVTKMKCVLISIRPKWCELIFSGKKTVEIRKTKPNIKTPFKCYIYETKGKVERARGDEDGYNYQEGRGAVIGEFVCDTIYEIKNVGNAFKVGKTASETNRVAYASCLDFCDMHGYFGHKGGYGWHISDLNIYDKPKKLTDFIRPSGGCCNEGKCTGCKFFDKGNGYNVEDDCFADFDTDMYSIVTRPPQSWCYVEE